MLNLHPSYLVNGFINELNIQTLLASGIQGLILDLDNTIMKPQSGYFEEEIANWLKEVQQANLKIIIVTNNKNEKYLNSLESILNEWQIPMLIKARKPSKKKIEEALSILNLPASQVCLVGDRVLTDIWGGYRTKCQTALVKPLMGNREFFLFRFLRKIERLFLHPIHW